MKIAILISGHLRTFRNCYQSVHKIFSNRYDVDIFIHTWSTVDHKTATWHRSKSEIASGVMVDRQEVERLYRPKIIEIEEQKPPPEDDIRIQNASLSRYGMKCMHYGKRKVAECALNYSNSHSVNYDLCVTARPDVLFESEIDLSIVNPRVVNFALRYDRGASLADYSKMHVADLVVMSSLENIVKVMVGWDEDFDLVYETETQKKQKHSISDATMLQKVCKARGLECGPISYFLPLDFKLLRSENVSIKRWVKNRVQSSLPRSIRSTLRDIAGPQ